MVTRKEQGSGPQCCQRHAFVPTKALDLELHHGHPTPLLRQRRLLRRAPFFSHSAQCPPHIHMPRGGSSRGARVGGVAAATAPRPCVQQPGGVGGSEIRRQVFLPSGTQRGGVGWGGVAGGTPGLKRGSVLTGRFAQAAKGDMEGASRISSESRGADCLQCHQSEGSHLCIGGAISFHRRDSRVLVKQALQTTLAIDGSTHLG